jgi:hypothetical protein
MITSWQGAITLAVVVAAVVYLTIHWVRRSRKKSACSHCHCSRRLDSVD